MRRWLLAFALIVSVATVSHAGELRGLIEGPAPDGVTYTVRTQAADASTSLEPWALAEGVVAGRHQSVLLRLEPTREPGVYRFTRRWPGEGRWVIRLSLGHPPAPATVAALRADGTVRSNTFHFRTDGFKESLRALHYRDRNKDC